MLHLLPFLNYSIHLWTPHLNLMVKRCDGNGVGLATPGRRLSPQADRPPSFVAERDQTCTGNRTGIIKTVKPHTHTLTREAHTQLFSEKDSAHSHHEESMNESMRVDRMRFAAESAGAS